MSLIDKVRRKMNKQQRFQSVQTPPPSTRSTDVYLMHGLLKLYDIDAKLGRLPIPKQPKQSIPKKPKTYKDTNAYADEKRLIGVKSADETMRLQALGRALYPNVMVHTGLPTLRRLIVDEWGKDKFSSVRNTTKDKNADAKVWFKLNESKIKNLRKK